MLIIGIVLGGMLTIAFLVLSFTPSKSSIEEALQDLDAHTITRDSTLVKKFEKIYSEESKSKMQLKLLEAGLYNATPASIAAKIVISGVVAFIFSFALLNFIHLAFGIALAISIVVSAIVAYMPIANIGKATEARKTQVQRSLPDFLDMVATTVQAGLSVNAALAHAVDVAPGALGDEIKTALSEIRLGRGRLDALRGAAERLKQEQFTTTITAITQAERLGSNISKILNELAEDVRDARIMQVEEKAAKLPVKMVIPMALFMLPAIFTVIFGALASNFFAQK